MPLRSALAHAVFFVVMTVAGCAGPPPPPPPLTPGPISTSPPAPLPQATDGDNLAACTHGSCVVRVKTSSVIPLDSQLGVLNIRVEAIDPHRVSLATDLGPGHIESYGCSLSVTNATVTTTAPGSARTICAAGGKVIFDKMAMGVVAIAQDTAVLRLITR